MIPNIHQSIEEIIKNASAAEKILWQQVRLLTGENAAVQQFYFMGAIVGSEFLVYSPTKLYLAVEFMPMGTAGSAGYTNTILYNRNNTAAGFLVNTFVFYNGTAATIPSQTWSIPHRNLLFSRINISGDISYVHFIGYKILG